MSEINEVRSHSRSFKFSDSFLIGFKTMISAYDKKIEELHNISSLIDKDAHHGVCNCSYKMRYITPENVSTFISNIEKAMANKLLKPKMGDCDLFAVSSVKKFLEGNGCVPFDAFSLMGNPGADIPKGATLADLTFAAESEVFNVVVYSKYELEQRAKDMKDDIKKIQDMHFSAAIKAFVDRLPSIMDSKANYVMSDALIYDAMERYIEDFIMFALRLNYTTVCQMIGYAIPRVAYKIEPASDASNESANNADNWDEDNEFFKQEAVDSTKVSPVFFIFTQGKGLIPSAIKAATDSEYSHVSISFDASLDHMYSFGTTGFRIESIHDDKRKDRNICVFGTFVSKDGVKKMKNICHDFEDHIDDSKFNYSSLVKKLFGNDSPKEGEYKEICSTFVNKCLKEVDQPLTDKEIPSPKEMMEDAGSRADQVFKLFEGNSVDYKKGEASKTLKKMGKEESTKKYDEVVTECCGFIKCNDYIITNRIPFNCNVRDIVLQDMHPVFKDTISALKFIMNDERSPIHQLVIQYFTEPIDDYDPELVVKMFMGCCHKDLVSDVFDVPTMNSYEKMKNTDASMNTDVNWLDKITYGNMFYDGNYRRDALGNNKVKPIMNSFETIYKMFGGCDNETDNTCLANNMIRISRVMKAIVGKYEEGCICDWEMCRDILAVFGEIFTRNMLRLYYNNTSRVLTSDQMEDAMGPGYMFHESYVLEASDMKHNDANNDTQAVGKVAKVGLRRMLEAMANWVRNTLSTFLPNFFKNKLQHQCDWVNKNADAKFDEIMKAANAGENGYKFPIKNKYHAFNVTFNPADVKAKEILAKYMNDANVNIDEKKTEIKKELMSMFGSNNSKVDELAKLDGEALQKAFVNMVLYGVIEPQTGEQGQIKENHTITDKDFEDVYKSLKILSKGNGEELSKRFTEMSKSLSDGIDELKNNVKQEQQPQQGNNNNNNNNTEADAKNKRIEQLNGIVSEISKCCYVASANAVVQQLYPEVYNTFKGVVDDFETMKNKGVAPDNNTNNGTAAQPAQPNAVTNA